MSIGITIEDLSLGSHYRVMMAKSDPCKGYVANPRDNTLPAFLEEAFKVRYGTCTEYNLSKSVIVWSGSL
jgi:hypothetical protein